MDKINQPNKINPKDISIVFCANNGYSWTKMAIDSFKYTNPEYKDRVILFNDDWKMAKYLKKDVSDIITWKTQSRPEDVLERVGAMYQECAKQINTKYICFIDNDTISLEENWLKTFLNELTNEPNTKILSAIAVNRKKVIFDETSLINSSFVNDYKDVMSFSDDKIYRFHYFCIIIDHEYFKNEWNINGYLGNKEYYTEDGIVDIGTEFYYFCKKNDIKFIEKYITDGKDSHYFLHVRPNPNNEFTKSFAYIEIDGKFQKIPEEEHLKEIIESENFKKAIEICNATGNNFLREYQKVLNYNDIKLTVYKI